MKDRIPTYPGRVQLTPVAGAENTYDMVRADVPTEDGTPLNKATLLTDSTAALLELGEDATINDVLFRIINRLKATEEEAEKVGTLITYGTSDLTAGTSNLATGTIYVKYR